MDLPERRRATARFTPAVGASTIPEPDDGCGAGIAGLEPGVLYGMVSGVDRSPRRITQDELVGLGDPMARFHFRQGSFPMTVQELLAGLPGSPTRKTQGVYLISEAGQIPPATAPHLKRDIRFAITRAVAGCTADLLISTGANADPRTTFLQVAAWDPVALVFNFYMRIAPGWVWAGNSWAALDPASRGRACFDSHVNGSVVMKELKLPWMNWQSQSATIQLAPDDPLRRNPLFAEVQGAENLELTIRGLINQWTTARLARITAGGVIAHPDRLLRQLLTTTTVNLVSSPIQSGAVTAQNEPLPLPRGFWLNGDVLLDGLDLPVSFSLPAVSASLYLESLRTFDFHLVERASGFSQPGDTFFAFAVPEAAYEDNDVVVQAVRAGLIPPKFAAALMMVDFQNPVFSVARARLMAYVPTVPCPASALAGTIADAITAAARQLPAASPEAQFAANWSLPDSGWQNTFGKRIDDYMGRVSSRIGERTAFNDYVRLAESRRQQFRALRLNEFELTTPVTNIPPEPRWRMHEDATVGTQP